MKKNRTKKLVALAAISFIFSSINTFALVLKSRMLELIDGTSFFDGSTIGMVKKIQRKILIMMVGNKVDGEYVGCYDFEDNLHSLRTFAKLETEINEQINTLKEKIASTSNTQEKDALEQTLASLQKQKEKLNKLLATIKKEFEDIVAPFLADARSLKDPMLHLITESCERRKKMDSLLLDWAKISGEDETDSFNKQVATFVIFYKFCGDLAYFLQDLTDSCPKAAKHFEEMKHKWEEEQKQNN